MSRADLLIELCHETGIFESQAEKVLNIFLKKILECGTAGGRVDAMNFCSTHHAIVKDIQAIKEKTDYLMKAFEKLEARLH